MLVTTLQFFLFGRLYHLFLYRNRLSGDHRWVSWIKLFATRVALAYLMGLVDELWQLCSEELLHNLDVRCTAVSLP